MLTNGAPDLQREKIAASGLESLFQAVVISGLFGIGKPRREIFLHLTDRLGIVPDEAMMVGNSLEEILPEREMPALNPSGSRSRVRRSLPL